MADPELIIVALGGNAITNPEEQGNVDDQFANSRNAARPLADLVEQGHRLVITHGNGPQIGNFLLRNDAAAGVIYPLPMEVAAAHVQGGMGFMIAQTLRNELAKRGQDRPVTTIITTVLVNRAPRTLRVRQPWPNIDIWIAGTRVEHMDRVRLEKGDYPILVQATVKEAPDELIMDLLFDESGDERAEYGRWYASIDSNREILERVIQHCPKSKSAKQAKKLLSYIRKK